MPGRLSKNYLQQPAPSLLSPPEESFAKPVMLLSPALSQTGRGGRARGAVFHADGFNARFARVGGKPQVIAEISFSPKRFNAARGIAHAACAPRARLTRTLTLILSLTGRGILQSSPEGEKIKEGSRFLCGVLRPSNLLCRFGRFLNTPLG